MRARQYSIIASAAPAAELSQHSECEGPNHGLNHSSWLSSGGVMFQKLSLASC